MAKRRTSADLQAEILKLMEAKKELARQERAEAREVEEKLALKLGRIVLELHKCGFNGFNKTAFVKQVAELVGCAQKEEAPAPTATGAEAADDAQVGDAKNMDVTDGLAESADGSDGITDTGEPSIDETSKSNIWGN